jgi:hypothetical protein
MVLSALVRRCRSAAPFVAFIATAVLAIVLAAQAQLVCSHAMLVAMPAMAGMEMAGMATGATTVALCPVVLILGIAAALLTANAIGLVLADPHRASSTRTLARRCAQLPVVTTAGTVIALGSAAVGTMMALDHSTPAGIAGWLLLAGIIAAIAVSTSVIAVAAARVTLALTRRIAVAIACAIALLRPAVPAPVPCRNDARRRIAHRVPLLAARRGLRAPPFRLR